MSVNINVSFGGGNSGGGFPGFDGGGFLGNSDPFGFGGGSSLGAGSPLTGFGSPMNGMGASLDPMAAMMMSMSMSMMSMVMSMMGQFAMSRQGGFGGMQGMGANGGTPLGDFLGSGSSPSGQGMGYPQMGGGAAPGGYGYGGAPSAPGGGTSSFPGMSSPGAAGTPATASGPAGVVGNVNVERLVNAIPEEYRDHARQHWPAIVAESQKQGITNKAQLAYILATTVHESAAGKYMEELADGSAYEGRSDLGNSQAGDGVRYKGRGYVQITGRNNYTDWSNKLGVDLVGNPELAERPEIAAQILVGGMKTGSFTGKGLDAYINDSQTDFVNARRIVNGTDKAQTFAATAQAILGAMG